MVAPKILILVVGVRVPARQPFGSQINLGFIRGFFYFHEGKSIPEFSMVKSELIRAAYVIISTR